MYVIFNLPNLVQSNYRLTVEYCFFAFETPSLILAEGRNVMQKAVPLREL